MRSCRHPADKPRRRALQLFSEKVAAVAEEAEEEEGAMELAAAAAAAAHLCALLPALLGQAGARSDLCGTVHTASVLVPRTRIPSTN